jgi:hypothetical protein
MIKIIKNRIVLGGIAVILLSIMVIAIMATPALAFDPPPQSGSDATDVILWYGENFTIKAGYITADITIAPFSANINMPELEQTLINVVERWQELQLQNNRTLLLEVISFLWILIIIFLAFWHRDKWLYVIAGFSTLLQGFSLWTTDWKMSIFVALVGLYCFIKLGENKK